MGEPRYRVVEESISASSSFVASVIDTQLTEEIDYLEPVICECFDIKDARTIAASLNREDHNG